jgi:hypothetical protein
LRRDEAWRAVIPGRPDEGFELFADGHELLLPFENIAGRAGDIVAVRTRPLIGASLPQRKIPAKQAGSQISDRGHEGGRSARPRWATRL